MKNINKINITIDKDDSNVNDYLIAWSELNNRPNKTTFHGFFETDKFKKFLDGFEFQEVNNFTDYIPNEETPVVNQRCFGIIEEDIYLAFTSLDKNHEDGMVTDINFFFNNNKKQKVEEILENLYELSNKEETELDEELVKENIFILHLSQNGFELETLKTRSDFEDIEYYYEDDILKKVKKTAKLIKKENKGLTIISGERGCGKTNLLSFISSKVDKKCIFIPCNLIENSINNCEFRRFLKQYPDSIILLDDIELYLSQIYSKSNLFTNNLLQLVDGLQSDSLNLNIILSMNCNLSEIDKTVLESNSIIDIIEVCKLSEEKLQELSEFLGKEGSLKSDTSLNNVLKGKKKKKTTELGFK